MYDILEIIDKKSSGNELTKAEIEFAVMGYVNGEIPDYQISSLLMAIKLKGMSDKEVTDLTDIMLHSGELLELGFDSTDKHSTGGVGDKTTIVLAPLVAALGVKVAKMSGRGLGHTGGTIDKLESINGFKTSMSLEELRNQVDEIGVAVVGQMGNLCPADKKLYALRDVTGTVSSIPLIASSIMSKKIASGASKIVLDVTCGNGAFMKTKEEAVELAKVMKQIGNLAGKETVCIITNMEEPLGYSVGNTMEMIETLEALKGDMMQDVKEVVLTLGSYILKLAGKGDNIEENKAKIEMCLLSNLAYEKFIELVEKQEGDASYCRHPNQLKKAEKFVYVTKQEEGYIKEMRAELIGKVACYLGAGRTKKEDEIDNMVGVVLVKKVADKVKENEVLRYEILWTNVMNTFTATNNLYYGLKLNGNVVKNILTERVPRNTEQNKALTTNVLIQPGQTHTYELTLEFRNTEFNQDIDKGKVFKAKLRVESLE